MHLTVELCEIRSTKYSILSMSRLAPECPHTAAVLFQTFTQTTMTHSPKTLCTVLTSSCGFHD